jgi:hypothetical protein
VSNRCRVIKRITCSHLERAPEEIKKVERVQLVIDGIEYEITTTGKRGELCIRTNAIAHALHVEPRSSNALYIRSRK